MCASHDAPILLLPRRRRRRLGPLLEAARRRFFELLFDGKDEAGQTLAFSLDRRAKAYAADFAKLETTPDEEWLAKLTGDWKSPVLGKITIRAAADGRALLDAGEWKSTFSRVKESDERSGS